MTLFTAFYVPDGIVITSDSRLTLKTKKDGIEAVEILSDEEPKIFLLRNEDVGLVYTAEGMPDGFKMTDFIRNMKKFFIKPEDTVWDITSKIATHIRGIEGMKPSILIAGFDYGESCVCLIENNELKVLNRDKEDKVIYAVTLGGNLKRVNQFFDYERDYDEFSIEEAMKYGCYLVKDSIEHLNGLDEYSNVGGNIQCLEIRKTGGVTLIR